MMTEFSFFAWTITSTVNPPLLSNALHKIHCFCASSDRLRLSCHMLFQRLFSSLPSHKSTTMEVQEWCVSAERVKRIRVWIGNPGSEPGGQRSSALIRVFVLTARTLQRLSYELELQRLHGLVTGLIYSVQHVYVVYSSARSARSELYSVQTNPRCAS